MNYIKVIGTPLYQWESGRKMQIIPLPNTHINAVHFSNFGDAEALVVNPREENGIIIADIPNILLQSGRNIVVYTVNISDDSVETLIERTFSVRNRAKPSDYVYTETEVLTITTAVEKALQEAKESGEFNGKDGKDGVPDYSLVANSLKGYANGNPVVLTNVSPLEHEVKANLSCKNLFYFAETLSDSGEFEVDEEEVYTAYWSYEGQKGTSEFSIDNPEGEFGDQIIVETDLSYLLNQLDPNKQYTISVSRKDSWLDALFFYFNGATIWNVNTSVPLTFYPKEITEPILKIEDMGSKGDYGIQIEEGTAATTYVPYVESANGATVTKYGKNLVDISKAVNSCLAKNADGTYTFTKNGGNRFAKSIPLVIPTGTPFAITAKDLEVNTSKYTLCYQYFFDDGTHETGSLRLGNTIYNPRNLSGRSKSITKITFYMHNEETDGASFSFSDLQIEIGTNGTEVEPYKEPITYTADENGNVKGIIGNGEGMTLLTDEGVSISAEYNKDLNKVIYNLTNAIISLGGNV